MKRKIYISLFIFLGFLLQLLAHAYIEIWYIGLLSKDFEKYNMGFSWDTWFGIHHAASVVFILLGVWFGYAQGVYWWERIYVKGDVWFMRRKHNKDAPK